MHSVHPILDDLTNHVYRLMHRPMVIWLWVEPQSFGPWLQNTALPYRICFFVVILDSSTGNGKFIVAHGGITDNDDTPVLIISAQDLPSADTIVAAAMVLCP